MKLVTGMVASLVIGCLSFWRIRSERDPKRGRGEDESDQGRQHHDLKDDLADGRPTRSVEKS